MASNWRNNKQIKLRDLLEVVVNRILTMFTLQKSDLMNNSANKLSLIQTLSWAVPSQNPKVRPLTTCWLGVSDLLPLHLGSKLTPNT